MDHGNVWAVVMAAREATHAASNLAHVTAAGLPDKDPRRAASLDASLRAAEAAFRLDDVYRRNNGSPQTLEAAEAAVARAIRALETTRMAIASGRVALAAAALERPEA